MDTRVFSAYNLARGVLLNSRLAMADSGNQPLRLLDIVVSGMGMDPTTGLWLTPLHAVPAVPRVFPFDLVYMDKDYRVLEIAEMGPGIEFPPFHSNVASALILPSDILRRTQTASGDRLIVCIATELEALLASSSAVSGQLPNPEQIAPVPAVALHATEDSRGAAIIELTPEKPAATVGPRIVPGFEYSIRTAVAEAADNPPGSEVDIAVTERISPPLPPASHILDAVEASVSRHPGQFSPGPSMDVREAVFDFPRHVPAAIIEHHIDPEDLFSNWVVSPPPAPAPRLERPSPPVAVPVAKPTPSTRTGKPNGNKAAASNRSAERTEGPAPSAPETATSAAQPKSGAASAGSDKPTSKPKQNSQEKSKAAAVSRVAISQLPPANTFTAVPYGMWQVSMPTAVAQLAASRRVASPEAPPIQSTVNAAMEAKTDSVVSPPVAIEAAPAKFPFPASPAETEIAAEPSAQDPKPQTGTPRGSSPSTGNPVLEEFASAPKPILSAPEATQKHVPGDFVATLQEKLQRAQHSKLESITHADLPQKTEPTASVTSPGISEPTTAISAAGRQRLAKSNPAAPSKFLSPTAAQGTSAPPKRDSGVDSNRAAELRPEKAKTEVPAGTLRSRFKHWLNPLASPSDRRRNGRRYVPGMVAHYFTGGAPKPHDVADISMTGMYLLTDDRWMPGTMIQMTLQKPCARGERKQSINVLSRIVRRGSDGVAAEFVMAETLSRVSHDIQPSQATDKFALARFL